MQIFISQLYVYVHVNELFTNILLLKKKHAIKLLPRSPFICARKATKRKKEKDLFLLRQETGFEVHERHSPSAASSQTPGYVFYLSHSLPLRHKETAGC